MRDGDDLTITVTLPRQYALDLLAYVAWARLGHAEPVRLPGMTLPPAVLGDSDFVQGLPSLVDEVAEAALVYVKRAKREGWRVTSVMQALAAHEEERANDAHDMAERYLRGLEGEA